MSGKIAEAESAEPPRESILQLDRELNGPNRIRGRKRSHAPPNSKTDPPNEEYRSVRVARRRNINSSRAKAEIPKASAENQGQLYSTSRLCSNVRSVER